MAGGNRAAFGALQALLWLLCLGSFTIFAWLTFIRPNKFFRNGKRFADWFGKDTTVPFTTVDVTDGYDHPLLYGLWTVQVVVQWGCTLLLALCAAGLRAIHTASEAGRDPQQPAAPRAASALGARLRAAAMYRLPPRWLWDRWCGGLSALDAVLVAAWLGLHVDWVYSTMDRVYFLNRATWTKNGYDEYRLLYERLENTAVSFGWVSVVSFLLLFYPLPRSAFFNWLLRTDFSHLVKYHRWASHGAMLIISIHSLLYYILWGAQGRWGEETFKWQIDGVNYLAGSIATWVGLVMWFTSSTWFRSKFYEVFYRTHVVGFLLFTLFTFIHYKYFVFYSLPGMLLYLLDAVFRLAQLGTNRTWLRPQDAAVLGSTATLDLHWAQDSRLKPGQTLYLRVPSIAALEVHPFTVVDVAPKPGGGWVTRVMLNAVGDWTAALVQQLRASTSRALPVFVEGPYDHRPAAEDLAGAHVVVFAGGRGLTSVLGWLHGWAAQQAPQAAGRPARAHLVFSARTADQLAMLGGRVMREASRGGKEAWLSADVHYTGHEEGVLGWVDEAAAGSKAGAEAADRKAGAAGAPGRPAPSLGNSSGSSSDSGAGGAPSPLDGAAIGPLGYALCALLTFFGAFGGLLIGPAYDARENRTKAAGSNYPAVGCIQFLAIFVGAMLPPACYVLPVMLARRARARRAAAAAAAGGPPPPSFARVRGRFLECPVGPVDGEQGGAPALASLPLRLGRPRALDALGAAAEAAAAAGAAELVVVSAGPAGMHLEVQEACSQLRARRGGCPPIRFCTSTHNG